MDGEKNPKPTNMQIAVYFLLQELSGKDLEYQSGIISALDDR